MPHKNVEDRKAYRKKKYHAQSLEDRTEYQKAYYQKNKDRLTENNRNYYAENHDKWHSKSLAKYGMNSDDYSQMLNEQKGVCKICKTECKTRRVLSVDHCHDTGTVRGLLCSKCNSALGFFNDDPTLLQKAMEYLRCE